MEELMNKIYAITNEKDIVVKLFSTVFEQPTETDVFIEEGNEEYHAHVHLKYNIMDMEGRANYKIEDGKLVELTDEEKEILYPKPIPVPTDADRIAALEEMVMNLI